MQRLLLTGTRDWTDFHTLLTQAGYEVRLTSAEDDSFCEAFASFRPDGLLLELGDDIFVLQHVRILLRAELNAQPVPLLGIAHRSHLNPPHLVVGVDDFVLPPYNPDEVLARVQMLLWRFQQVNSLHQVNCGGLHIDLARRWVTADGCAVTFTLREYQLLQFLVTHSSRAFTRESLLLQVWGYDFDGNVRVVDAYIKRVRAKLPRAYADRIETVRGIGYRFSNASW